MQDLSEAEFVEVIAPPSWRQFGALVLDGSVSMTWELEENANEETSVALPSRRKADAADAAVRDLLNRLRASRKQANFSLGFVSFNDRVTDVREPRDLSAIDPMEGFDPTAHGTGGTKIASGLARAHDMVRDWLDTESESGLPTSAVVIGMSDGEDSDPEAALSEANRIRSLPNTEMATCLFATKGGGSDGARLLQAMSSRPDLYRTVYDAEQLRQFFLASLTVAVPGGPRAIGPGSGGSL